MADLTGNYEGPLPGWGLGLSEEMEGGGLDKLCQSCAWRGHYRLNIMDPNIVYTDNLEDFSIYF